MSLTPVNSLSSLSRTPAINTNLRTSPRIFVKVLNGPEGQEVTDSWQKSKILCQTPFKLPDKWFCLPASFNDTQCLINHMHLCKKRYTIIKCGRKVRFFNLPIPVWSTDRYSDCISHHNRSILTADFCIGAIVSGRFKVQFLNRPILLFVLKVRFMCRLIVNIKSASTVYTEITWSDFAESHQPRNK